jgi:hypothetical protein
VRWGREAAVARLCCGTTPAHRRELQVSVAGYPSGRPLRQRSIVITKTPQSAPFSGDGMRGCVGRETGWPCDCS